MRGAPQVGFSETIRKIKARTSLLTRFRPPTWLTLETHVQYNRNPARCQFTTVLGVTKMRGLVHPDQNVLNATQNSLCRAVNRRRGCCACRASNCRRRARFSRMRSPREWKAVTNQPRKCRSDTIMARIVAEKSESSFSQVIHSASVRRIIKRRPFGCKFVALALALALEKKGAPVMESTKYVGLDVHKEATTIAVMNSAGKLIMESIVETKAITFDSLSKGCTATCMSRLKKELGPHGCTTC